MWTPLTLGCPSPRERQALGLTAMRQESGSARTADQVVPLRDTGPSVPKEKKVRLRLLCVPEIDILLKHKSPCELK